MSQSLLIQGRFQPKVWDTKIEKVENIVAIPFNPGQVSTYRRLWSDEGCIFNVAIPFNPGQVSTNF